MINGVEVVIAGVSKVSATGEVCLIGLLDRKKNRQLAVLCDEHLFHQVYSRMSHEEMDWSDCYPEVFASLLKETNRKLEVDIYGMSRGIYQASLVDQDTGESKPVKCSHAIFMALVADMPIYVDADLMRRMGTPYEVGATKASLPISVIPERLIKKSMDEAIAAEDYELASELRDELKRRSENESHENSDSHEK